MDGLREKTFFGLIYKLFERIGAQAVQFFISLILARLLLPEEYGQIALVLVLINILNVFITYGFGSSLIAYKDSDEIDFSTCFYFSVFFSVLVYLCVFYFSDLIAVFFGNPKLSIVIQVMALQLPIAAVNSVQHAYVSKYLLFKKFLISTSIGTVLSGLLAIIVAYKGFGIWALVIQYLGKVVADTICLWIIVGWRPIKAFSLIRLKKIYDFGWKILVVGLIDSGYNELRSVVIAKKYTSSDLAYYNKGNQFPSTVMSIIEPTINGVLFPALAQCNDNQEAMRNMTRRLIMMSCYLVFPMMIGLLAIAEPMVRLLLTDKWLPCVVYLQIGCLGNFLRPLQVINNCVIKASGRGGLLLKLNVLKKSIGVLLLFISVNYGVIGIAISLVITDIISTMINIAPNRKILSYGYRAQLFDVFRSSVIAILMGIIIYAMTCLHMEPFFLIVLQVLTGTVFYILVSKFTKNECYIYAMSILKTYIK